MTVSHLPATRALQIKSATTEKLNTLLGYFVGTTFFYFGASVKLLGLSRSKQ